MLSVWRPPRNPEAPRSRSCSRVPWAVPAPAMDAHQGHPLAHVPPMPRPGMAAMHIRQACARGVWPQARKHGVCRAGMAQALQ